MSKHPQFSYRPDIDGLRAVAILGVVCFHAGLGLGGGYAGVDVFFVISGYLITALILKDLRAGAFSILHFWERRARRILPALTATVVLSFVAGWFLLFPEAFSQFGRSALAAVFFVANVSFWREDGYFGGPSESKPLLHTWSLSVEEQFYLIIPFALMILFRLTKARWIVPILGFGFIASLALSLYAMEQIQYRTATFFLLPTRAWELLAGSLLVFVPPVQSRWLRAAMGWGGVVAIACTFFLYTSRTPFPGLAAVPPVAGAFLLIWAGTIPGEVSVRPLPSRCLSWRPVVFIGLISYSLYLIHWPIFAYHHVLFGRSPGTVTALLMLAAAVALSVLSWKFIETPFRKGPLIKTRRGVFAASAGAMACLFLGGVSLFVFQGFQGRFSPEVLQVVSGAGAERQMPGRSMTIEDVPDGLTRFGCKEGLPRVLLWGDSHADAALPGVDAACRDLGLTGLAVTSWVTPPVKNWYKPNPYGQNEKTAAYNQAVFEFASESRARGELPIVILAANWLYYTLSPSEQAEFGAALEMQVRDLRSIGCEIVILRQFPFYPDDVPRNLALTLHFEGDMFDQSMSRSDYLRQREPQDAIFDRLRAEFPGLRFVDPLDAFLGPEDVMRQTTDEGYCLYLDHGHVSPEGALLVAEGFKDVISSLSFASIEEKQQ